MLSWRWPDSYFGNWRLFDGDSVTALVVGRVNDSAADVVRTVPVVVTHFACVTETHLAVAVRLDVGLVLGVVLELVNLHSLRRRGRGRGRFGCGCGRCGRPRCFLGVLGGLGGCAIHVSINKPQTGAISLRTRRRGQFQRYPAASGDDEASLEVSGVFDDVVVVVGRPKAVLADHDAVVTW